jgi:hypothetical protein
MPAYGSGSDKKYWTVLCQHLKSRAGDTSGKRHAGARRGEGGRADFAASDVDEGLGGGSSWQADSWLLVHLYFAMWSDSLRMTLVRSCLLDLSLVIGSEFLRC